MAPVHCLYDGGRRGILRRCGGFIHRVAGDGPLLGARLFVLGGGQRDMVVQPPIYVSCVVDDQRHGDGKRICTLSRFDDLGRDCQLWGLCVRFALDRGAVGAISGCCGGQRSGIGGQLFECPLFRFS